MFLVVDATDGGTVRVTDDLDDDLLEEAVCGDVLVIKHEDGQFKQLDPETGIWGAVES